MGWPVPPQSLCTRAYEAPGRTRLGSEAAARIVLIGSLIRNAIIRWREPQDHPSAIICWQGGCQKAREMQAFVWLSSVSVSRFGPRRGNSGVLSPTGQFRRLVFGRRGIHYCVRIGSLCSPLQNIQNIAVFGAMLSSKQFVKNSVHNLSFTDSYCG
jgi:hypothetical protein